MLSPLYVLDSLHCGSIEGHIECANSEWAGPDLTVTCFFFEKSVNFLGDKIYQIETIRICFCFIFFICNNKIVHFLTWLIIFMHLKKKKLAIAIQCLLLNTVVQASEVAVEPQSQSICNYVSDLTCLHTLSAWLYPADYDVNMLNLEEHFNLENFGHVTPSTMPIFDRAPFMIERILDSSYSGGVSDVAVTQPWFANLTNFPNLYQNPFEFFKLSQQPLYATDYHRIGWLLSKLPNYMANPQNREYVEQIAQHVITDFGRMLVNILQDNQAIYQDQNMALTEKWQAHAQALAMLETFFYLDWSAGATLSIQPAAPDVFQELYSIVNQHVQVLKSIYDADILGPSRSESMDRLFQQPHMLAAPSRCDGLEAEPEAEPEPEVVVPPWSQSMMVVLEQLQLNHPTAHQYLLHWLGETEATDLPDWNSDIWYSSQKTILYTWQKTSPEPYMQNMMHELDLLLMFLNTTDIPLNDPVREHEPQTIRSFLFETFHQVWQRGWAIQNLHKEFGNADIFNNLLIKFFIQATARVNQSDWSHPTEVLMSQNLQYIQTRLIRTLVLKTDQPLHVFQTKKWIRKIEQFMEANIHQINFLDSIRWRAMLNWYEHFYYLQKTDHHNSLPLSQAYRSSDISLFQSILSDFDTPMGAFQTNLNKIKDYEFYAKDTNKLYHDFNSQIEFRTRGMRVDIEATAGQEASDCHDYNCIVETFEENSSLDTLKKEAIVAVRKMEVAQQKLTNNIEKINQFLMTYEKKLRLNSEILNEMSSFHDIEIELKRNLQKTQSLANEIAEPMGVFGSIMAGIGKVMAAATKPWSIIENFFVGAAEVAKTARNLVTMQKQHLVELRQMDAKNEHDLKMKRLDQELGLLGDMTKLNDLLLEQSQIIKTLIQEKDAVSASITKFKASVNQMLVKQNTIDRIITVNAEKYHLDLSMDSRHDVQIKLFQKISYVQKYLDYAKSSLLFEWQDETLADQIRSSVIDSNSSTPMSEQIADYILELKSVYKRQQVKFIQKRSNMRSISLKELLAATNPHLSFSDWLANARVSKHAGRYTLHFSTLPNNEMMLGMLNPPYKFDGDVCHYQPGHVLKHINQFAVSFITHMPVNQNAMASDQMTASLSYGGQQYFAAPHDSGIVHKSITPRFLLENQPVDRLVLPIDINLSQSTLDVVDRYFNNGLQGLSSSASDWALDFYLGKSLYDVNMIEDIHLVLKQNYYTYRPTCK
jgi:hypothetical protein